ncbi:hypothetical protein C2G38_2228045 [Gigaspora rosea]|uniref:Uncharacterized protein n=1 Tax=Gigaspora rosea TaxID=44941 RepID=A0A397U5M3_9GLOM|nr:hypothetical protein C2G38_2228045 [Gigaspora rosea]
MDKLVKNRDIFKKKFSQIAEALIKQQQDVLKKDKRQSAKKEISEEKIKFIELDISKSDEARIKYRGNSLTGKLNLEINPIREIAQQNINKRNKTLTQDTAIEQTELTIKQRDLKIQGMHERSASDKYKKILLEQEYKKHSQEGYRKEEDKTEVGQKDIYINYIDSGNSQDQYTEQGISLHTTKRKNPAKDIETESIPEMKITARIKKTKTGRGDIYESDWAPRNSESYFAKKVSQPNNTYAFILWDIPLEVHAHKIKDWLFYYGKATIERVNYLGKTKSAVIRINSMANSRLKALKTSWAIQSENGKTLRTMPEEQ